MIVSFPLPSIPEKNVYMWWFRLHNFTPVVTFVVSYITCGVLFVLFTFGNFCFCIVSNFKSLKAQDTLCACWVILVFLRLTKLTHIYIIFFNVQLIRVTNDFNAVLLWQVWDQFYQFFVLFFYSHISVDCDKHTLCL